MRGDVANFDAFFCVGVEPVAYIFGVRAITPWFEEAAETPLWNNFETARRRPWTGDQRKVFAIEDLPKHRENIFLIVRDRKWAIAVLERF